MTSVKDTMNKYIDKTLSRSEKNKDYFTILRGDDDLCYCVNGKAYLVYSLYVAMDFGDGMALTTFYDKYIAAAAIHPFALAGREEEALIITDGSGYQVIGIDSEKLEEAEDKEMIRNPKTVFLYFRTKYRHNFMFVDNEHSSIRLISDSADVDDGGNPRPDAVTSWCVSMFAPKPDKTEDKPAGQNDEAKDRSGVKKDA